MSLSVLQERLLDAWVKAKKELDVAKTLELEYRQAIVKTLVEGNKPGTHILPLENGWRLKCVQGVSHTLDQAEVPALLQELHSQGVPAENLIRAKYEIKAAAYNALPDSTKKLFSPYLTIKPTLPTLALEPPKE